jgi:hypothetical protein
MSQSTLLSDLPGGPPPGSPIASLTAATLHRGGQWLQSLDRILRGEATRPQALRQQSIQIPLAGMSLLIFALALAYGFCMGMFPGCREEDASYLRWLACTVKIPAMFFLTLAVTFPSLYVVNALVGSRLRLPALLQLLIAALAVNLAVLASAGPIVAFFSFSTSNTPFMVLLNVLVFAISGVLGMKFLLQTLHRLSTISPVPTPSPEERTDQMGEGGEIRPEVAALVDSAASDTVLAEVQPEPSALDALEGHVLGQHVKTVFWIWTLIFSVVGAQMAWVLRPYFGSPGEPFVWFAPRSSNFFEGVWRAILQLF